MVITFNLLGALFAFVELLEDIENRRTGFAIMWGILLAFNLVCLGVNLVKL